MIFYKSLYELFKAVQAIIHIIINYLVIFICAGSLSAQDPDDLDRGDVDVSCASSLIISKFAGGKAWKVIASQSQIFDIKVNGSEQTPYNPPYSWQLGDGTVWPLKSLNTISGNTYVDFTTQQQIKMPMNNSDFGETHGVVKLTNNNGTVALSTDPKPNKKVKVFFEKDAPNQHNPNVPNWFYYWSQLAQAYLTVPGIKFYNSHTNSFNNFTNDFNFTLKYHDKNKFAWPPLQIGLPQGGYVESVTYGRNEPASYSIHGGAWPIYNNRFAVGYPSINHVAITDIIIGKGCGYHNISNSATGVEVFCETVFHELEHWKIFVENWKDGIDLDNDSDQDNYNDAWEVLNSNAGFSVGIKDSYGQKYDNQPNKRSVGYIYEEDRCRMEQIKHTTKFNTYDWSYSNKNKYQGKNY